MSDDHVPSPAELRNLRPSRAERKAAEAAAYKEMNPHVVSKREAEANVRRARQQEATRLYSEADRIVQESASSMREAATRGSNPTIEVPDPIVGEAVREVLNSKYGYGKGKTSVEGRRIDYGGDVDGSETWVNVKM